MNKLTVPSNVWSQRENVVIFTRLTTFPDDWTTYRKTLRRKLWQLLGVKYDKTLPLDFKVIRSAEHDGITLRHVTYQTRPGVYTTATIYTPKEFKGRLPGVVNMHGHWQQGRVAARVQSRGFMLAKSGYAVISVDTFGTGERSIEHGKYEYHGRLLGSSIFNIGETLMGCQIVDNMRAVDVLCSLPEVDSSRIGATGASGGGNQTMYLAAMDDRVKAAVPVCSVGSFESYLYEANCCCETLPGGLQVTEMAGILALAAPRAMLICTGLYDVKTFSPQEMLRSYDAALVVYKKLGAWENFTYRIFNHGHMYSPMVRESMLGFFEFHLKGKGRGMPMAEPEFTTLPEEEMYAFEVGKRPEEIVSIAKYCNRQGEALLKELYSRIKFDLGAEKKKLASVLKFDNSLKVKSCTELSPEGEWRKIQLELSDGACLPLAVKDAGNTLTLFTNLKGKANVPEADLAEAESIALLDLSYLGELAPEPPERVCQFHQTARRFMWLGKTLSGRWASELAAAVEFLDKLFPGRKIVLHGCKETATASLFASVFSEKVSKVILEEALVSYLFKNNSEFCGMASFIPGFLKWGDIPLACAMSNAVLEWRNPRNQDGSEAEIPEKEIQFFKTRF